MVNSGNFNLLRWFAILSPMLIGLIAIGNAVLISSFLSNQLFTREANISRDFVQNIMESDGSIDYLVNPGETEFQSKFAGTVQHLTNMRDILRTNVYGTDRIVLWSTDSGLIGKKFSENDELDGALAGELVVHAGSIADANDKEEHVGLDAKARFFVESYIPIQNPVNKKVVGVVELYKAPVALTQAIEEGRQQVALAALLSAVLLYLSLYGLVRRADRLIKEQRNRLMEAETMSVVGELTSAVAHNIRNPLSSIRSSAEMILSFPSEDGSEHAREILHEVDRISARILELLRLSGKGGQNLEKLNLGQLLSECLEEHRVTFSNRQQSLSLISEDAECFVLADRSLLLQVFISLLSNASEAMAAGGECNVRLCQTAAQQFQIDICDQGEGIDPQALSQVFRPFFTTKPKGLGLGLPLAKRIVERFGGTLRLDTRSGTGTLVRITLPKA